MLILAIGGIIVMLWGIVYIIIEAINQLFGLNIDDTYSKNIALVIIDIVLLGCGIYCGWYGILTAIFFCIALHNGLDISNDATKYKNEMNKKTIAEKYDNDYGIIDWKDK